MWVRGGECWDVGEECGDDEGLFRRFWCREGGGGRGGSWRVGSGNGSLRFLRGLAGGGKEEGYGLRLKGSIVREQIGLVPL